MTVKELIKELKKQPRDATVHAYEGEGIGIVVRSKRSQEELAFIETA